MPMSSPQMTTILGWLPDGVCADAACASTSLPTDASVSAAAVDPSNMRRRSMPVVSFMEFLYSWLSFDLRTGTILVTQRKPIRLIPQSTRGVSLAVPVQMHGYRTTAFASIAVKIHPDALVGKLSAMIGQPLHSPHG
jgi:hypothetical protein